jgi:hypothetical protein
MAAEHTNKTSCQEECSKSRYKWYCNKTLGQCTRDFRGTYNNLETCWKNCYDQVSYYCDIRDGLCKAGTIYGSGNMVYLQFTSMTLEECSQKCRPVTRAYLYNENNNKCSWANPEAKDKRLINWNECIDLTQAENKIRYSKQRAFGNQQSNFTVENKLQQLLGFNPYSLGKNIYVDNTSYQNNAYACFPTPTGEYSSFQSCFQTLGNGYDQYRSYSGYTCDYKNGNCVLTQNNAEFQSTTLEDAHDNCVNNCGPFLDEIIKYDYSCRFKSSTSSTTTPDDPKLHACYIAPLTAATLHQICYNHSQCKVFNNWLCAHEDTKNISKVVFTPINQTTCKNNQWDWIGRADQKCLCERNVCVVVTTPPSGINQDPRCNDGICDKLEKYRYLHDGTFEDPTEKSNYSSPGISENRLYCPSDCK